MINCSYLIKLTIHLSASSVDMLSFSANMEMEMHWWILQNVSKIIILEFSIKSSRQATCKIFGIVKQKNISHRYQEKVIDQNRLAIPQLLLSSVKVKVDVQILDEAGDGVLVGVGLLLDHLDQVLHHISPGTLVTNDSGGQISQDPRTGCLDGIEIRLLVEK